MQIHSGSLTKAEAQRAEGAEEKKDAHLDSHLESHLDSHQSAAAAGGEERNVQVRCKCAKKRKPAVNVPVYGVKM